ncbi:hypothetical protein ACFWW8_17210, partial [Streptomyces sp. NPDC058701]
LLVDALADRWGVDRGLPPGSAAGVSRRAAVWSLAGVSRRAGRLVGRRVGRQNATISSSSPRMT